MILTRYSCARGPPRQAATRHRWRARALPWLQRAADDALSGPIGRGWRLDAFQCCDAAKRNFPEFERLGGRSNSRTLRGFQMGFTLEISIRFGKSENEISKFTVQ